MIHQKSFPHTTTLSLKIDLAAKVNPSCAELNMQNIKYILSFSFVSRQRYGVCSRNSAVCTTKHAYLYGCRCSYCARYDGTKLVIRCNLSGVCLMRSITFIICWRKIRNCAREMELPFSQLSTKLYNCSFIDNVGLCLWSRKWFNINDVMFYDVTALWGSNNSSDCQ